MQGWGQWGGAKGVGPMGWGQWGGASGAGPVGRGGASLYTCALVHEICTSYTYSCVCVRACVCANMIVHEWTIQLHVPLICNEFSHLPTLVLYIISYTHLYVWSTS